MSTTVIPIKEITSNDRQCDGCTMCCDGWLPGSAHGHQFWPGRPCHFSGEKGCTIYENRPDHPCKSYVCAWLTDLNIPAWLKPSTSDVIMTHKEIEGIPYLDVVECGKKIEPEVLSWLFFKYLDGTFPNIFYRINSGSHYIGTQAFLDAQNRSFQPTS